LNSTNAQWTRELIETRGTFSGDRPYLFRRLQKMAQKVSIKPLTFALGAAFASTLSGTAVVNAADNPFTMTELSGGYMVAEAAEGKCGGDKAGKEGKCGEGKSSVSEGGDKAGKEGKCGEGKSSVSEGGDKAGKEGKCGEGKCGGSK
jgi:uncharacterized low-complexity protein